MTDAEINRLKELDVLIREIELSPAWTLAMRELDNKLKALDDSWQNANADTFFQLQVTKLAVMEVSGLIDEWKEELEVLKDKLKDEQSPSGVQEGDFDNEVEDEK